MNWTGKSAKFFIENGKLTALIMLALFFTGISSFYLTPKKYNPTIIAPAFQIITQYPGASRQEVLEHVTKPIENIITNIPGVEDIYSVSIQGGMSIVNVNFYVGENLENAKVSLNDRINSDIDLSPYGVTHPLIKSIDPEEVPVITIALSSHKLTPIELRKEAFRVRNYLSQIKGSGVINVYGGKRRELNISINQDKLLKNAVSVQHIIDALKRHNVYAQIGNIKTKETYLPLEIDGRIKDSEEIKKIVVLSNNTIHLTVGDLAEVSLSEVEDDFKINHRIKNKDIGHSVLLSVAKLKGTNITDVTNRIKEHLTKFQLNSDVSSEVIVNEGDTAAREINNLLKNLFSSIAIVAIILVIFLGGKSAILVAVAIPLTLASVFIAAYFGDQSINRITLFALILSLGLLVDNATVVIENITRKLSENKEWKLSHFYLAVDEVGPGLVMSTITTLIAFFPMAFISGMMGPYMGPIPFFVPAALTFSLFLSLSINPWMASIIMKKESLQNQDAKTSKFILKYKHYLRELLKNKKRGKIFLAVTLLLIIISASLPVFYLVKFRMLPKADVNQFYLYVDLKKGSSLEQTVKKTQSLEDTLLKNKNIKMVQSYIATSPISDFNGLFKNTSARKEVFQSTIRVGLVDKDHRDTTSEEIVLKLRNELNELFPNIKLKLIEDPPGPPVMSTYLLKIEGHPLDIYNEAKSLKQNISAINELKDLDTSIPEDSDTYSLKVNHIEATKTNIAPGQIMETLNILYKGHIVGLLHNDHNLEQEYINLRFSKSSRATLKALDDIYILNQYRIPVPLSRLVNKEKIKSPIPVYRENEKELTYISAEMGNRSVTYAGIDSLIYLFKNKNIISWDLFGATYKLENGRNITVQIGGEWELTLEVFRDLILAMLVAIALIYFVLIAQFKSYIDPLIIMSTIPLSVIGVFPGFMLLNWIQNEYFTATSMIGIIALAGIAVNNSIILLEYLNSLKHSSINLEEAIIEACSTRIRPIALTTITTVLGSMTILGDPVWSGLAWSIILGLGVSSLLILIVFPVLYNLVHNR